LVDAATGTWRRCLRLPRRSNDEVRRGEIGLFEIEDPRKIAAEKIGHRRHISIYGRREIRYRDIALIRFGARRLVIAKPRWTCRVRDRANAVSILVSIHTQRCDPRNDALRIFVAFEREWIAVARRQEQEDASKRRFHKTPPKTTEIPSLDGATNAEIDR
jgi:hypothetical protein